MRRQIWLIIVVAGLVIAAMLQIRDWFKDHNRVLKNASPASVPQPKPGHTQSPRRPAEFGLIAHALGGLNGRTYLNCREAFESNYRKGYRYFEVDLMFTSNGELVCLHDGLERKWGLPVPFTLQQFRSGRPDGLTLSPLTFDDLLTLMQEKPDWNLVTDVKDDNQRALTTILMKATTRHIDVSNRIIPQIYGPNDEPLVQRLEYERWILTVYRMGPNMLRVAEGIVQRNARICAITMPAEYFVPTDYRKRVSHEGVGTHFVSGAETPFQAIGVPVFVHTVNNPADAALFLGRGIGLYTARYFDPGVASRFGKATKRDGD
jgi:glycerophosphoryl diester phosphodiesterase